MSFYLTRGYVAPTAGDPPGVKTAWRRAYVEGHEVGLHSVTHTTSKDTTAATWTTEIVDNLATLVAPYTTGGGGGVGLPRPAIYGWRTPFLGTNDLYLPILLQNQVWYDTSLEEGFEADQDGTNNFWPYTLDEGSPGDAEIASWGPSAEKSPIAPHAGLWEMPVYTFIVPPDAECATYGVPTGLRARLQTRVSWFDIGSGKLTGFDYNMWTSFWMSKAEVVATLKYTLDLHLRGNRAPMPFNGHTDYYADNWPSAPNATGPERRAAVQEFLEYALSKPEVRVTSMKTVLDFMRSPRPLSCY